EDAESALCVAQEEAVEVGVLRRLVAETAGVSRGNLDELALGEVRKAQGVEPPVSLLLVHPVVRGAPGGPFVIARARDAGLRHVGAPQSVDEDDLDQHEDARQYPGS